MANGGGTSCPGPLKYYEDLGCTPEYKTAGDRCPVRYNCSHMQTRVPNKCYINGHEYELNETLKPMDANVCDNMCTCKYPIGKPGIAAFECTDIKSVCPTEHVRKGCYLMHDLSKCCGDPTQICPEKPEDRGTCVVDGKEYKYGEYFRVKSDHRLNCVCKPGYEGRNVPPFCERANHSICDHPAFSHKQHFYQKCAPVFASEHADPDRCILRMRCRNPNDRVVRNNFENLGVDEFDERNMCEFGDILMQIGDTLEQLQPSDCVMCICQVPPVPTCTFLSDQGYCYFAGIVPPRHEDVQPVTRPHREKNV
ncbi:PREDICTED: uncharacterized protein LOC105563280 [Vollenhovia emeryi]|uniref:uncharacterized protein LOC105563280 n=1 Tax=Vollenhovia emeryi TaxID=411798 RepID=UPI0005F4E3E9|nr:PREDICTED: uncharacterized protein LOC105563280 [Vollenhovia emeryi]